MQDTRKYWLGAVLLGIVGMAVALLSLEGDVLYRIQELSLFLPTRPFYHSLAVYPGGTLSWAACYLTQFFYHTALGVALLAAMWAVSAALIVKLYRLRGAWTLLSLLAPLALLAALTQEGYWIYYMKLPGHAFVPTLAVLIALLSAWVGKSLPYWPRLAWLLVVGIAGYPFMGAWSFLAVAAIATPQRGEVKRAAIQGALALALIAVVPQVMCRQWYGQTQPSQVYLAALPSFQFSATNCTEYHYAYYALALAFVLPLIGSYVRRWQIAAVAMVGAYGFLAYHSWYRDANFHREVAMTRALNEQDYQRVLDISASGATDTIAPTRTMTVFKNLALFRLHRAGDEMYRYPEGATRPAAPWAVRMTQVGGKLLYYHYGKENFCYRWCMEDCVEYGWTVDGLRLMVKSSLLNHDWEVARKYINLLKRTRYHRDWALHYEPYIGHEEMIMKDPEMEFITHLRVPADRLDGDNTLIELYLLQTFANGHGADPLYEENTLLAALQMKDIDLFWPRFVAYAARHGSEPNFHMPRHFQEAAYLFSQLEPQRESAMWPGRTNAEALQQIPFDQQVKDDYTNFMQWNQQYSPAVQQRVSAAFQPRINEIQAQQTPTAEKQKQLDALKEQFDSTYTAQLAAQFRPAFGHTYYYAYFLVRNQKAN